jgi:hypothetical protein
MADYRRGGEPVPLPDPDTIPNPAYLVIGVTPGETPKGRMEIFNNPQYYFFDIQDAKGPALSRYIKCDINDTETRKMISKRYSNKFDVIITDYNVSKFMPSGGREFTKTVEDLFDIVKQDGVLILDDTVVGGGIPVSDAHMMSIVRDKDKKIAYKKTIMFMEAEFIQSFMGAYLVEPISYIDLIAANPVAYAVYHSQVGPLNRLTDECIVIRKSIVSFGGKRKIKSKSKRRKTHTTKRRSYRRRY